MKNKEQQFINAYEDFLNDCPDAAPSTPAPDSNNDLSFTEACMIIMVIAIIIFIC